jgi:carboxypeptidase T
MVLGHIYGAIARVFTVAIILVGTSSIAVADTQNQSKQILRFKLVNSTLLQQISEYGIDIAGVDLNNETVDLVLRKADIPYVRDLIGLGTPVLVAADSTYVDDEYHTSQEVAGELAEFASQYSSITKLFSIGKSHEGRDIWAIKISDNPETTESSEPSILFNAMHHAREVMTTEVAMDTVEYLLTRYADDNDVRGWVNENEIYIVPMLNVDGNNKVWTSNAWWRKNTRSGYGVDLNRNYPYNWNGCSGSSGSVFSDTYRGPSAGSEPESQALMRLVEEIRPVFDISYHSYSELVLYPFGCPGNRTPTQDQVESIGRELANMLPGDNGRNKYAPGTPWELLYAADGGDIDWMYGAYGVIPYVIELNSSSQGFQPSYERWRNKTVTKLRPAWQLLLNKLAESGVRGKIEGLSATERMDNLVVSIEGFGDVVSSPKRLKVRHDGTFQAVLPVGSYSVTVSNGAFKYPPTQVTVGSRRTDMVIEL